MAYHVELFLKNDQKWYTYPAGRLKWDRFVTLNGAVEQCRDLHRRWAQFDQGGTSPQFSRIVDDDGHIVHGFFRPLVVLMKNTPYTITFRQIF